MLSIVACPSIHLHAMYASIALSMPRYEVRTQYDFLQQQLQRSQQLQRAQQLQLNQQLQQQSSFQLVAKAPAISIITQWQQALYGSAQPTKQKTKATRIVSPSIVVSRETGDAYNSAITTASWNTGESIIDRWTRLQNHPQAIAHKIKAKNTTNSFQEMQTTMQSAYASAIETAPWVIEAKHRALSLQKKK